MNSKPLLLYLAVSTIFACQENPKIDPSDLSRQLGTPRERELRVAEYGPKWTAYICAFREYENLSEYVREALPQHPAIELPRVRAREMGLFFLSDDLDWSYLSILHSDWCCLASTEVGCYNAPGLRFELKYENGTPYYDLEGTKL